MPRPRCCLWLVALAVLSPHLYPSSLRPSPVCSPHPASSCSDVGALPVCVARRCRKACSAGCAGQPCGLAAGAALPGKRQREWAGCAAFCLGLGAPAAGVLPVPLDHHLHLLAQWAPTVRAQQVHRALIIPQEGLCTPVPCAECHALLARRCPAVRQNSKIYSNCDCAPQPLATPSSTLPVALRAPFCCAAGGG